MNPIRSIFCQFKKERPKLEMSITDMKRDLDQFEGKILLYGAGSSGIAFLYILKKLGIVPRFFVDGDSQKKGTECEGVEVITLDEVKAGSYGDYLIIVCINTDGKRYCKSFDEALRVGGHHAVYDRLREAGCRNIVDYTYFRHCYEIFRDEKYNAPSCSDVNLMLEHEDEIADVYDLLSDELSRETYEKIVRFRLVDDTLKVPSLDQKDQYFEEDIYQSSKDAVFVDCGAFRGNSLETFLRINGHSFCYYYGLEPDVENYQMLNSFVESFPRAIRSKMVIINAAAWNQEDRIKLYALQGPGSFVAEDIGKNIIESVTIDGLTENKPVSFIKMNIEGSEKEALEGAKGTIQRNKPQLAIAGYHRTDDLWRIPLQITSYEEHYRLKLRSYMNHISFVYYGL